MSDAGLLEKQHLRDQAGDADSSRNSPPPETVDIEGECQKKLEKECKDVVNRYRAGEITSYFAYGHLTLILVNEHGKSDMNQLNMYS